MRILVVFCHPSKQSLAAAALERALKGLATAGHETQVIDLYAENFNPVLDEEEWLTYKSDPASIAQNAMKRHVEALEWAEGLLFVTPTWTFGLPAMLKGWLDRVLLPGVSFDMPTPEKDFVSSRLRRIRFAGMVTSCGSPWWIVWLSGHPGRKVLLWSIRMGFAPTCKTLFLSLYHADLATPEQCQAHLDRVEARLSKVK